MLVSAALIAVAGCSSSPDVDPGIACKDGYTAHPDFGRDEDGCGSHGGARDRFQDQLDAWLAAYPDGTPSNYVCADGWRSDALYRQGACSSHGGVASLQWPDGSQVTMGDPPTLIRPDGTTQSLDLASFAPTD
jgi:hypothetical protein